jgi:hypothetical protein
VTTAFSVPDPGGDADSQLAALGLRATYFHDAIRAGEAPRRRVTPNHPVNTAGSYDYAERVATLREILFVEAGWNRLDINQVALTVNPARDMAIGVMQGDARTGLPGHPHPKGKRPMGAAKYNLIIRNELALFPRPAADGEVTLDEGELASLQCWFLLTFRYQHGDVVKVRSELSLPTSVSPGGTIAEYQRRILLPEITFEGVIDYLPDDGDDDFDVPVEER